jgi:hypothetical protein
MKKQNLTYLLFALISSSAVAATPQTTGIEFQIQKKYNPLLFWKQNQEVNYPTAISTAKNSSEYNINLGDAFFRINPKKQEVSVETGNVTATKKFKNGVKTEVGTTKNLWYTETYYITAHSVKRS